MVDIKNTTLKYRAQGAKNGIEILTVGSIGLIFIMVFNLLRPGHISIIEIFLVSLCIAAILIGFLKTQEPFYSIILTEQQLTYQHKYGHWDLIQENFHHCGIPTVENGVDYLELNAIGIKLNDIDAFLTALAPRIAGKLLIEQRHFFMQVVQKNCKNGHCPSQWLVEDNKFRSKKGIDYNGLIAMFANRAKHLQLLTGYDLLLPASAIESDIWEFSANLNKWKRNPSAFIKSQFE